MDLFLNLNTHYKQTSLFCLPDVIWRLLEWVLYICCGFNNIEADYFFILTVIMEQDLKQASSSVTVETLLTHLANSRASGCLQISCEAFSSVSFFIYLWEGKLYYATNSLAPFERLDRHLRRLSNQNTRLNSQSY